MTILILGNADSDNFWIRPNEDGNLPNWDTYFKSEIMDSSTGRQSILKIWEPITLQATSKSGKFGPRSFKDIHGFGMLKGFENIVSDRFRELFLSQYPDCCTFLPLTVEQSPFPYWGLWANHVIDAIDDDLSQVLPTATGFKNIGKRKYKETLASNEFPIFRLPMKYAFESDQVTESFREFVNSRGLTNFRFYDKNI